MIKTISKRISDKIILPAMGNPKGMGDIVALVAQPIAKMIDAVAKTDIQHCGGCKKRQEKLNDISIRKSI
jgi:hypothetical protein